MAAAVALPAWVHQPARTAAPAEKREFVYAASQQSQFAAMMAALATDSAWVDVADVGWLLESACTGVYAFDDISLEVTSVRRLRGKEKESSFCGK